MVSGVDEITSAKEIINEERKALKKRQISVGQPGLGAMIEVPSAVLTVSDIARHTDFSVSGLTILYSTCWRWTVITSRSPIGIRLFTPR